MILYNKFLINLINSQRSSNIVEGKEFDYNDVFSKKWDDYCKISYEDYLANQNDKSFLSDIDTLDKNRAQVGLVIENVSKLSAKEAEKIKGKLKIFTFDPEEERVSSNGYLYPNEYVESRKKLDDLITQIDLSEPDELKKAKQLFILLRKQYTHGIPATENILDGLRFSQTPYGCLILNKGVCRGGATTYRALCSLANIKSKLVNIIVTFPDGSIIRHALNQICINGEWGIVDVEQKKENPENITLFFCNQDIYRNHWEKAKDSYVIDPLGSPVMPTNVSLYREYIDNLGKNDKMVPTDSSKYLSSGNDDLKTLAINEIMSENVTLQDLEKTSSLLEREGYEHE